MSHESCPAIAFRDVSRAFEGRTVLNSVSFDVAPREVLSLIGRSGQGKSVTLKLLIGLMKPDSGEIYVGDENIVNMGEDQLSKIRRRMGFLFQSAALFDSMTLYENLAVPLKRLLDGTPDAEIDGIVRKNLEDVGLGKDAHKMPGTYPGYAQTGWIGQSPHAGPANPAGRRTKQRTRSCDRGGD